MLTDYKINTITFITFGDVLIIYYLLLVYLGYLFTLSLFVYIEWIVTNYQKKKRRYSLTFRSSRFSSITRLCLLKALMLFVSYKPARRVEYTLYLQNHHSLHFLNILNEYMYRPKLFTLPGR